MAGLAVLVLVRETRIDVRPPREFGDTIDELNGVAIYYNGPSSTTRGRNLSEDGYNLGLRYQCVEFVKRYYFERLHHRMPDAWGHAKDFFDPTIPDGALNPSRALVQFRNGGASLPRPDDLIIFGPSVSNEYGHVAIVSKVDEQHIEIAQQNPGPRGRSRVTLALVAKDGGAKVDSARVLGWLRIPASSTPINMSAGRSASQKLKTP